MTDHYSQGQTTMEAVLLMPLFLMVIFMVVQIGHVGLGIALVNYAASSVARQAVTQNHFNKGDAETKFKNLLMAGLSYQNITGNTAEDGGYGTQNVYVTACAELPAYPLVGPFLQKALRQSSAPPSGGCSGNAKWWGPVGVMGPPYHFIIQGQAVARMNYNANG